MSKCKVEWCSREGNKAKGFCSKHYAQVNRHGKVSLSYYEKNIIHETDSKTIEVELRNVKGDVVAVAIADIEDRNTIEKHKWYYDSTGYARTKIGSATKSMHQLIKNTSSQIDHINRNKLDNRKKNLRPCTPQQNIMNHPMRSDNTSGFVGVHWHKMTRKWASRIQVNGKGIHCGLFPNIEDAIAARLMAEAKYFKEFSPQKQLHEQYGLSI
jgi:hypothetical protein